MPKVITQQADLTQLVEQISSSPWLAMDTEFMRESTYYPELCLIQIATENISVCIDVVTLEHIDPLLDLLKSKQQIKIFHSCRQDLEVLFASYQFIPEPIFDTQVAASILGLDEQISYAELVAQCCSVQLAKTESRTDWKKRPLTSAQINYALDDVRHLGALYIDLLASLNNLQRYHWLSEECEQLLQTNNYYVTPENAWKFVKGIGRLDAKQFYYARQIADWRESHAQKNNVPRRWVIPDAAILELCQLKHYTIDTITRCLLEHAPKSRRHTDTIIGILMQAIPDEELPTLRAPDDNRLSKEQRQLIKQLMQITRHRANEINTSASLLANRKSLVNLVLGKKSKISSGWRKLEIADHLHQLIKTENN